MVRRIQKLTGLSIVLMLATVISLPGSVFAATSPVVKILSPVSQGLRTPVSAALDSAGNYYVADPRNGGIVKYSPYGVLLKVIKTAGIPQSVAVAQDGRLLVSLGEAVVILNGDGSEAGRFSDSSGPFKFGIANGMAVDDVTGFVSVVDSGTSEVVVFTASGLFSSRFGVRGSAAGQLSMPTGIAFEKLSRQLAVADTLNNRIQFFSVDGVWKKSIGSIGSGPLKFVSPQAVAFEYSKDPVPVLTRMYVVDTFQSNVQVIDPSGAGAALYFAGTNPLDNYIGSYGKANGQLMVPSGVIFDQKNSRLLVVNGFGNITVYGIDGGGNPVDTTPPALSIDPVLATVFVPNITISGTVGAGATVAVTTGAATMASPVVYTSSTTWKSDVTGLVAGANVISVTATDAAGNTTPAQSVGVTYVLPAPSFAVSSKVPALTNIANLVVAGTVDAGATVTVTNTKTSVSGSATVIGTSWSYPVTLSEGMNNIRVSAQRPMSNATAISLNVALDTAAPVLAVSALSNGSYTSNQVQNIYGTVTDANAVTVLVNNNPATLVNGSFSMPVTLATGSNLITVVASDAAGNSAPAANISIFFDAAKPVVSIASPVDNSFTNKTGLQISGSVDKPATVTVAGLPVTVDASNNWSANIDLKAGLNTVEVVATDLYGNTSTVKRSITLDAVKPILSITSPVQDVAVNTPNVTISGSVNDSSNTSLSYSLNGKDVPIPVTNGNFTFNVDFQAEGNYPVLITATDAAGNYTTATRNLIYDVTPPALTVNASTGVAPTSLSGTVESGASVVVKEGVNSIGKVTATSDTWSADLTGISYNPELLSVVAVDAAGNSSIKTLTYIYPDGDLDGDGKVTVADALRAIRIFVGKVTPTPQELAHGDIGPLLNGKPNPNGKIDIVDAMLILRKAVNLQSW